MFEKLPSRIQIIEVGPRDGLQNEKTLVSTADKARFIQLLIEAGVQEIEATSFVKKEKIPQMGDAQDLSELLKNDFARARLMALVPNDIGFEAALKTPIKDIALFTATSDTFNQKNINASIEESMQRLTSVAALAKKNNMRMRGYISTVFGCPYEGKTSVKKMMELSHRLFELGVEEISLGDTIGVAHPKQVSDVIQTLKAEFDLSKFAMHFHDTRAMALANIATSIEMGITRFDASAAGLGGCPYAKGASGNMATEEVVHLCQQMGIETGIDLPKLVEASRFILAKLNRTSPSKLFYLL